MSFLSGDKTSGYNIDVTLNKTFSGNEVNSTLGIELAVGQLDLDGGMNWVW